MKAMFLTAALLLPATAWGQAAEREAAVAPPPCLIQRGRTWYPQRVMKSRALGGSIAG